MIVWQHIVIITMCLSLSVMGARYDYGWPRDFYGSIKYKNVDYGRYNGFGLPTTTSPSVQGKVTERFNGQTVNSEVEVLPSTFETTTKVVNGAETTTEGPSTPTEPADTDALLGSVISQGGQEGEGILSLLGVTTTTENPNKPKGNFDKYLDTILGNLARAVKSGGFDPFVLPRVLICRNCSIQGLSLIRRGGPANLVYANKSLIIDVHLKFPAVYVSCFPCILEALSLPIFVMPEIAIWDLQVYVKLRQKIERNAHPVLEEYRVENEGELDIDIHNYSVFAPLIEFGGRAVVQRLISRTIQELVYQTIPTFVQEQLKRFSLPIG